MTTDRLRYKADELHQPATWAEVWHLWTVFIPRRTITGRLVYGKVWRRNNGRRWIYKRFIEFDHTGELYAGSEASKVDQSD